MTGVDELQAKLDEVVRAVEGARAVPMSASCLVNRVELLALLGDLRRLVPSSVRQADRVLREAEAVVADAQEQAEQILVEAEAQRAEMVSKGAVHAAALREAERITTEAGDAAQRMRAEVDDYVDAKLANFEVVLSKTLTAVARGRQKLAGRTDLGELDEPAGGFPG